MTDESLLGRGFRFGVATAGFQVEGGFNGPGPEPRNNWYRWESDGRVEPSGMALDFWNRYPEQLDRAASLGCDSFRLSVEWARCEPGEGRFDEEAFAHYGEILEACRARGLEPLVTLHHFTHPDWLGTDLWLEADSARRFAAFVEVAAERLGPRCSHWVTLNEPNILALSSYVLGAFPPGRVGDLGAAARALDNLGAAHVLAYEAVHKVVPGARVGFNNFCFSIYEIDRLLVDVVLARSRGVTRDGLADWLAGRRSAFYASPAARGCRGPGGRVTRRWPRLEELLRRAATRALPLGAALDKTAAAVYDSPHERCLDAVQIDYYDPETAAHLQPPLRRTSGGRLLVPSRPLWEDPPNPAGLVEYAKVNSDPGLEVWVVENGLCNRVLRGRSYERPDGWTRERYLHANLGAVVAARDAGVPLSGYWHWSLADNYEWGSYEPRFGIFGVDRERGVRWSDLDSMGDDAAGTYRGLIDGLRRGDRGVIAPAG